MSHYTAGYDIFTPDPGERESMGCTACGKRMDVQRNVEGSWSSVEAMAGSKRVVDVFTCPNSNKPWHKHLIELYQERDRTKTRKIKDLVQEEIDWVLLENRKEIR
jgi:hypothetical protein